MLPVGDTGLVALPPSTVRALATAARGDPPAAMRSAGQAGGTELAAAFEHWLITRGDPAPASLPLDVFSDRLGAFLGAAGWGSVAFAPLQDVVVAVDVTESWEARAQLAAAVPCCHITTGALAAFFSVFSPSPVAALEVECSAADAPRCRVLLGPAVVLDVLSERIADGDEYLSALAQISGAMASA